MDPGTPYSPYSSYSPPAPPAPTAPPAPQLPATFEHEHPDPDVALGRKRESFFKRRIAPIGAALLAFLAKIKSIILLLPKVKLLTTAGTMLVSVAAYATIWGFSFAAGFVILILVHEMGHVIALRREGIKASAPLFIPFMGAVIGARSLGDNALAEARVGLAGPILGSIGAGVSLAIWAITGDDFWRALGYTGLLLNLFNLLPVVPLDGGRAMAAMTPWMWLLGFAGIVVLVFTVPSPIILIIAVFAAYETYRRFKQRRSGSLQQEVYYRVSPRNRVLIGAVYLSLVVVLAIGMNLSHLPRTLG